MRELDPRRIVLQESRGERSSNGELQTGTGVGIAVVQKCQKG